MRALDTSLPPPDVPTGEWHDGLLLGYRPMDDTHQEFVALVTRLRTAPEDELPAVLDDFWPTSGATLAKRSSGCRWTVIRPGIATWRSTRR